MNNPLQPTVIRDDAGDGSGDIKEERSRLTHQALDDVDAGRVIDHLSVQAWADSLSTDIPLG